MGHDFLMAGRPGRYRSEEARVAILEATRDELADRGYDKLSIDRVAAAAGTGKQTIYRWYPSKSVLVAECILRGYIFRPDLDAPDEGDVRDDIANWAYAFVELTKHTESAALIRAATAASAEDGEVAVRMHESMTLQTVLTNRIRKGEIAGQLKAGTPAEVVAETLVGALLYRLLTRQPLTHESVKQLLDIVFAGIQA